MTPGRQAPLLQLKHVSKSFGSTQVLNEVDFSIEPGEVVALLGDNGAGKSTLVKIISGVTRPTSGTLHWEGRPVEWSDDTGPLEARQLGVETVYQDLGLVETLSIARNFFLGRELKRKLPMIPFFGLPALDLKRMEQIAAQTLKDSGIRRKLDPRDPVRALSGGERQAIAISRARYFGAKLLILDEPTSALSLRQTEEVLRFIAEASESGIAVIFITHTLAHIEGIVSRMTILHHGRKVGDYSPKSLTHDQRSDLILRGQLSTPTA